MNQTIHTLAESSVRTGDNVVIVLAVVAGIALLLLVVTGILSVISKKKK